MFIPQYEGIKISVWYMAIIPDSLAEYCVTRPALNHPGYL